MKVRLYIPAHPSGHSILTTKTGRRSLLPSRHGVSIRRIRSLLDRSWFSLQSGTVFDRLGQNFAGQDNERQNDRDKSHVGRLHHSSRL